MTDVACVDVRNALCSRPQSLSASFTDKILGAALLAIKAAQAHDIINGKVIALQRLSLLGISVVHLAPEKGSGATKAADAISHNHGHEEWLAHPT